MYINLLGYAKFMYDITVFVYALTHTSKHIHRYLIKVEQKNNLKQTELQLYIFFFKVGWCVSLLSFDWQMLSVRTTVTKHVFSYILFLVNSTEFSWDARGKWILFMLKQHQKICELRASCRDKFYCSPYPHHTAQE